MKKILIIDDDELMREVFSTAISNEGFTPAEASNWREAVELVRQEDFDAVLIDLIMPEKNGIDTMLELKKIRPNLPIIFVSGHSDVPTAVEAMWLGAYDYVMKPPDFRHLFQILRKAMGIASE